MIPVLSLDPASLSLWYDPQFIHQADGAEAIAEVIHYSLLGDFEELLRTFETINNEKTKTRCIHLVSSVWHEQRHFLDMVLTNYGAFRIRQFFSLYANLGSLMHEARENSRAIPCPLDLCLDPVRCELLNISPMRTQSALAQDVFDRKEFIRSDREVLDTPVGTFEMGGEAQLEALAYLSQYSAVQEVFGINASLEIQKDLLDYQFSNLKYKWVYEVGIHFNLMPFQTAGKEIVTANISFLFPIIFASLICRKYKQQQSGDPGTGSAYPKTRLLAFIKEFRDRSVNFTMMTSTEIWELVNATAKKLWGRTIVEELDEDYKQEAAFIELISNSHPVVKTAIEDFHTLRGGLIQLLKADPKLLIDPDYYWKGVLPWVAPMPVICASLGHLDEPLEGWERVFGYQDPNYPKAKWWWASIPKQWPNHDQPVLTLYERVAWAKIISYYAPVAKLLLNGMRHKTMLGPELISLERQLLTLDIKLEIDPLFAFPEEKDAIASFYALTDKTAATCDICTATIPKPEGHFISPWVFRYSEKNAEYAIQFFGGGIDGHLTFWRDWSPWIVCETCMAKLRQGLDWL